MKMIRGFLISLQFLTALPINMSLPMDKTHIEKSIQSFPLLGLLQGALYTSLLYVLIEWTPFSSVAIAFMIWLCTIIITGGIHLDGWMDASDAFFSYQDKGKRLEIMKDPRTGAFGVLSVLILLGSRFLFIYEIIGFVSGLSFYLIIFIPFLSKVVMGTVLLRVPAAKKDGLASFFKKAGNSSTLKIYPVYLVALLSFIAFIDIHFILPALTIVVVALGCSFFIQKKSVTWFGGITGDVLGASTEGTENILWMTLWLLHYFVMG
ncbi:adenosylcobinamide-GDP ribazoletransferase [Oceanobacillus salinisoli]|uniref:adenosylcobinamide-GDP ribazoletransferase n=1 Tax=Oceanobacillus salinisoli TaxID=2678611 RepID=UPI0012E18C32|nr:adenosylcobinamide-GDP ribazoletransferase [Oceanobacillus salinisoli]